MAKPPTEIDWDEDSTRDIEWDEPTTSDVMRADWGDAANSGASVQQPPPGPESIADAPYGPIENPRPVGAGEALVRAYLAGFAKQGSDEGVAALAAYGPGGDSTPARYREARDLIRAENANAEEQHPVKSFAANMAGDISSDLLLRRLGVPITSQGYQVASGALSGLLGGTADLTQPDASALAEAAGDTALGGGMAYAIPAVGRYAGRKLGPVVSRGAERLSDWWEGTAAQDWLEQAARARALKAVGWIQKDFPKKNDAPAKLERLLSQGQTLLDEPDLIGPFSSKAAIRDRLEPLVDREGRRIGAALDEADAVALDRNWTGMPSNQLRFADDVQRLKAAGKWTGGPFNPYAFIDDARQNVAAPFVDNPSLRAEGEGVNRWLNNLSETSGNLESRGDLFTFRRANEYKGDLQNMVFNDKGTVKANKAAQDELQRSLTRSIDTQAEPFLGSQGLADFRDARWKFGAFKGGLDKAVEGANRDLGNNWAGLKDMQAAQLAAEMAKEAESKGMLGAGVAMASKLARGRGDSFAARTADALAQPDWLQSVAATSPEVFGQWAQYMGAAAARSHEALGQFHNHLADTDPDYQRRLRLLGGQQE